MYPIGDDIRDLFLQLMIIISPCLLYQILWRDRKPAGRHNVWLIGILLSLAVIKCMSFPVRLDEGMLYDLRLVPVFLAFLYGGPRVGFSVTAVLIAYRAYIGGVGFYYQLAALPFEIVPLLFLRGYLLSYRRISRTLLAMSIGLWEASCNAATYYVYLRLHGASEILGESMEFFIMFGELYVIATGLTSYLVENMVENRNMRREIRRAEQLNVMGELAASIAHEVRNPITVTRGFMQLLGEGDLPEKQRGYVKIAMSELDRAESILSDYLAFAKPQLGKLVVVGLEEQVRNIVNVLGSYAALQNVVLVPEAKEHLPIEADPAKLSQVLMNIIKNGIEATQGGGSIRISASRQKNRAVLQIQDEGVGMTEEELSRLGDPFYSTKESGTGLGLMVSYRLIEAMNGTIDVQSTKGKGTQFTLTFPLADTQSIAG